MIPTNRWASSKSSLRNEVRASCRFANNPCEYLVRLLLFLLLSFLPLSAIAHSFGRVYNLPVPVWMYLYGAAAALILSFIVIGYFVGVKPGQAGGGGGRYLDLRQDSRFIWLSVLGNKWLVCGAQAISLLGLCLCIVTGLLGNPNPYGNFNMTFFWVLFVLAFAWTTVVVGNVYAVLNPWQILLRLISRIWQRFETGIFQYPKRLDYWPAVGFYMAFIWIELFAGTAPITLSYILLGYTGILVVGSLLFGWRDWLKHAEFFTLFLRLLAMMAPLQYTPATELKERSQLRLVWPFSVLQEKRASSAAVLVFVLFMLSSTAFDGLHETRTWRSWFWIELYKSYFSAHLGSNPFKAYPVMREYFQIWQAFWLLASPFVYLLVYLLFIAMTKWVVRSTISTWQLALRFAYSLLPIALVYHVTHYYTLVQSQAIKILPLASDPLGKRWDLFGTADWFKYNIIPDPEVVWHVQVVLIVIGHIISVYVAHQIALQTFSTHKQAVLSQIPMLILMVLFTTAGLWILSQPIQAGA